MTDRQRFVFDTNVLVSAVLVPSGMARKAFSKANHLGVFLVSDGTFAELEEVIYREKFDRYLTRSDRDRFLRDFLWKAVPISVTKSYGACSDPDDDKFLDLAVSGNADVLVTGNLSDFPEGSFRGVTIASPASFMDTYSGR